MVYSESSLRSHRAEMIKWSKTRAHKRAYTRGHVAHFFWQHPKATSLGKTAGEDETDVNASLKKYCVFKREQNRLRIYANWIP